MLYFHRHLDGHGAIRVLTMDGRDGVFLVRCSARNHDYAISVLWRGTVFHLSIVNGGDFYEIVGLSEKFASISDLIDHCRTHPEVLSSKSYHQEIPVLCTKYDSQIINQLTSQSINQSIKSIFTINLELILIKHDCTCCVH